jgi:hypothetical protein
MKRFFIFGIVCMLVLAAGFHSVNAETLGYFKFDSFNGSTFTDDSGKGLIGTLGVAAGAGAPTSVAGPSGDASDMAVEIPRGEGLVVDDSLFFLFDTFAPRTIEMWVKSAGFEFTESYAALVSYGLDSGYRIHVTSDGNIVYSLMGVEDFDTGVVFPFDDVWHHLAIVDDFDGNQIRMYLDGELVYTNDAPADNNLSDDQVLFIGRTGTTPNYIAFEGSIDRLRISNDALAVEELDSDAASVKPVIDSTVALYNFNEDTVPYLGEGQETTQAITLKDYTSGNAGAPEIVDDSPSGAEGDTSLYFADGAQASVSDPNRELDLGGPGKDWTVEAWVKYPDGNFTGRQVIFYYGPGGVSFSLSGSNPRLAFVTTLRIADFSSNSAAVLPDEWHHVACVHKDGESLSFFIDGELIEEDAYTGGSRVTDVPSLHIGSEPNGVLPLTGWIDRIRISDVALTADELDSDPGVPASLGDWSLF